MRRVPLPLPLLLLALCPLAACRDVGAGTTAAAADPFAQDPLIARALHDPLMTDPDLASRNEANALISVSRSQALPLFTATPAETRAAREALRLELLERGAIPDLPPPGEAPAGTAPLGPEAGPEALLAAIGAPLSCADRLSEDFALAADLPPAAAIPRIAMVVQAGGAEGAACGLRIVRYQTAAAPRDVLSYHHARALRAGLAPDAKAVAGGILTATGTTGERLAVHVREGANGLTGALVIHRAR